MNTIQEKIKLDINKFKTIVKESNNLYGVINTYGSYDNGKIRKLLNKLIIENGLDVSHFGLNNHPSKYKTIEKNCPVCKNKFETKLNHRDEKVVCSTSCSNTFFSKLRHTNESNEKRRNSLKKYYVSIGKPPIIFYKCNQCKKILCKKKTQKFCSSLCRSSNPEYRKSISLAVQKRIANGTHNGWSTRNIISYPEKFFMKVLKNNNVSYEHNKKVGKYFIDFAIENKMVALEIDGRQHLLEDRQKSDIEKDIYLKSQNWKVYRIAWKSINSDVGKQYIKSEIDKFLTFISS